MKAYLKGLRRDEMRLHLFSDQRRNGIGLETGK